MAETSSAGNVGKGRKGHQHHQHEAKYRAQFARTRNNKRRRIARSNGEAYLKAWNLKYAAA